jgi:hypothetical protein
MADAVFETPPEAVVSQHNTAGKWHRYTAALSDKRGEWGRTPFPLKSRENARQMASNIRRGRTNTSQKAPRLEGSWEAVHGEVDGQWFVWARRTDVSGEA